MSNTARTLEPGRSSPAFLSPPAFGLPLGPLNTSPSKSNYTGKKLAPIDLRRGGTHVALPTVANILHHDPPPTPVNMIPAQLEYDPMDAAGYPRRIEAGTEFWMINEELDSFSPLVVWQADDSFRVLNYEGHVTVWDGGPRSPPKEYFFRYSEVMDDNAPGLKETWVPTLLGWKGGPPMEKAKHLFLVDARQYTSAEEAGVGLSPILRLICPFPASTHSRWKITWRLTPGTAAATEERKRGTTVVKEIIGGPAITTSPLAQHQSMEHTQAHHDVAATASSMCKMHMLWNWETVDTCIVFRSWHVSSTSTFIISFLIVALIGVFYEWLREVKSAYDIQTARTLARGKEPSLIGRDVSPGEEALLLGRNGISKGPGGGIVVPVTQRLIRACIYGLMVFVSFFIMLIFMTYN
ncbi:hypothetical protein FRB97_008704, partial [Tulasnella sp. 331]